MVTADDSVEQIIDCFSMGAYNYILKPWNIKKTTWLVRRAAERHQLVEKNAFLLARAQKQPKVPVERVKSSNISVEKLMAPISKRFKNIDKSTIGKVGEAQDELKRQVLLMALHQARWNQVHAAKLLGIKRTTLRQSLSSLGIVAPAQHGRPQV